ncbi:MAG: hypothetical protein LBJ74_02060, partial [Heliobacteriaceae bacterium]|nr:hypothetical protein [Heliobacteriaceae bacterium]
KLKREYSVLSQAVVHAQADNGDMSDWTIESDTVSFMNTYLAPYLQITKNCGATADCWGKNKVILNLNGAVNIDLNNVPNPASMYLNDGANIAMWSTSPFDSRVLIFIDINGEKPPGKVGIDVFSMTFNRIPMNDLSGFYVDTAGLHLYGEGVDRAVALSNCSKTGSGVYCGTLYQADGWQISPDVNW